MILKFIKYMPDINGFNAKKTEMAVKLKGGHEEVKRGM